MPNGEFEIIGLERVLARLTKSEQALSPATVEGLKTVADKIIDTAQSLVRVDTASLKKSIRRRSYAKPAGVFHMVGVSAGGHVTNPKTGRKVDYAVHQEFDSVRGRPYMRPAVKKYERESLRIVAAELGARLKRV